MTNTEKKAWLRRYQDSLRQEKELAEEVEQLRARACRVSPAFTGMPGAQGDGQALPRAVEKILQAQLELQQQIEQGDVIRRQIVAVLESIPDPRDRELLRRKYLLGQRWETISEKMGLELRWVYRRHRRAISGLTIESPP